MLQPSRIISYPELWEKENTCEALSSDHGNLTERGKQIPRGINSTVFSGGKIWALGFKNQENKRRALTPCALNVPQPREGQGIKTS